MEIVPFNYTHFDCFLSSAKGEGWITAARELDFLLRNYPEGCLAVLDAGQPTAFITAIRYLNSAWIGNLLVLPAYRQRGLGRSLMERVLRHLELSGCETVWLTASAAGAHLYRSLGFRQIDSIRRWRGLGGTACGRARFTYHQVAALDFLGWGDDRRSIFAALAENSSQISLPDGFLACSVSGDGQQLGPWGAVSKDAAAKLLDAAIGGADPIVELVLDSPENNQAAAELLATRGFAIVGSTLLMYKGKKPEYRAEYIYALASMGSYG